MRRLEAQGIPSVQAEAITAAITEVLNDSLENVAQSFVSKGEMQKVCILTKFIHFLFNDRMWLYCILFFCEIN